MLPAQEPGEGDRRMEGANGVGWQECRGRAGMCWCIESGERADRGGIVSVQLEAVLTMTRDKGDPW